MQVVTSGRTNAIERKVRAALRRAPKPVRQIARDAWTLGLRVRTGGRVMLDSGLPSGGVSVCFEDLSHYRGVRRLWLYEREFTEAFLKAASDAAVIYDVGANVGIYSLLAARANPAARVFAFEPEPRLTTLIARSAAANDFGGIEVKRVCLGDENGEMRLALSGVSGHHVSTGTETDTIPTTVARIDTLVASGQLPAPNLIKIDAEGYEYKILDGMGDLLRTHGPDIVVEIHETFMERYGDSLEKLLALMSAAGYVAVRLRQPDNGETHNVHRQSHYLFTRQG